MDKQSLSKNDADISHLETFKIQSDYFINLNQALQALGKNQDWLVTLKSCSSRLKKLQRKGFSGKIVTVAIDVDSPEVEVISYQDWLILASYLAGYANQSAIHILETYAFLGFLKFHQKIRLTPLKKIA